MPTFRRQLVTAFRPELQAGIPTRKVIELDHILDRAGVPRDDGSPHSTVAGDLGGRSARDAVAELFRPLLKHGFSQRLVDEMDRILDLAGLSHDGTLRSDSPGDDDENVPEPVPAAPAASAGLQPGPDADRIIKEFEGCERKIAGGKLRAYPDPGSGNKPWTIGWGSTGPDIVPGTIWTQGQADQRFRVHLQEFARKVARLLVGVPTTQRQFDAMLSLAYNIGVGNFAGSTLLKKHRKGDYVGASREFVRWNRAAGKVMTGLTRRRTAEADLYSRG